MEEGFPRTYDKSLDLTSTVGRRGGMGKRVRPPLKAKSN